MNELARQNGGLEVIIALATNGKSKNTQMAYGRAITDYAEWFSALTTGDRIRLGGFTRFSIKAYVDHLLQLGLAAATINQRLSALRSLAKELKYADIVDEKTARGVAEIENVPDHGTHMGKWLSQNEARALLDNPDSTSLKGKQERVLISLLMGAALRRSEAADLTWGHIQNINEKWFIVNIVGKHNRKRTIPLAPWVMAILLTWSDAANILTGKVLRAINKSDELAGPLRTRGGGMTDGGMSAQAIYKQIKLLAVRAGITDLEPHSLRRTWAQSAYRQGCALDQISLILGHQDLKTTEIYLGLKNVDMDEPFYIEF